MSEDTELLMNNELAYIVCGSVDSGKSTLIGTIISGKLDDGNGLNRNIVSKHNHEKQTGKTSSISVHSVKNFNNNKSIIMIDLCGHQKYLKTTLYGITGYYPDYSIVIIGANRGILKMTREHIKILHHLKIPIILVLTKIDLIDKVHAENKKDATAQIVNDIKKIFSRENYNVVDMLEMHENSCNINDIQPNINQIPLFKISCKTGLGLNIFKNYISTLPKITNLKLSDNICENIIKKNKTDTNNFIFYIEKIYCPPGIGWVVTGILKCSKSDDFINNRSQVFLGPSNKETIKVKIWSMHNYYNEKIDKLYNGQRGCLAIRSDRKLTKEFFRKGCVIASSMDILNKASYTYKAKIKLLNHPTMIKDNFCPVIHCSTIRQSATIKIINVENRNVIDSEQISIVPGNTAIIYLTFKYYPELIEPNQIFFLREGLTLGVGTIQESIII